MVKHYSEQVDLEKAIGLTFTLQGIINLHNLLSTKHDDKNINELKGLLEEILMYELRGTDMMKKHGSDILEHL